ncbi:MAG TPA: efflux transporter outer membrane subunit [Bryobacteraceae bacterium]|nr:efflux transporter outer membrane subunit [Bryobacteraceae bacterium]
MNSRRVALVAAALLVSSACSPGPKYRPPTIPVPPAAYKESKEWKAATPSDAWNKGRWWEVYGDPLLNSLEEQVEAANQNLKSADAHFRQARALVQERRSARYPGVVGDSSIARNRLSTNRPYPVAADKAGNTDLNLGVDASYEPDLWGRVRTGIAASVEAAQAVAGDVANVRLSLQAELALDYFDLRVLDHERRILESSVKAYERALAVNRNRYEGGVATGAEVAEAETQLEATRAQAIGITALRSQNEHAIAVLTGRLPEEFSLAETADALVIPPIPTDVPSALLERRPDIAAAERRVALANTRIGLARIAFYPQVMLRAAIGMEGRKFTNWIAWPSRLWALGPSAAETIFDGGRRRAALESATANYDATVADYRQQVLDAFRQVEDCLSNLRILEEQGARQSAAIDAARRSEELSMNRYKGGLVTYLEVVTAQAIRLQNERAGIEIQRRSAENTVLLIKALGGGWQASAIPQPADLTAAN